MTVWPRLLDHPFYSAWTRGEVPLPTLAAYHRAYGEFIREIPSFWETVVKAFRSGDPRGESVIAEETDHILLWEQWGKTLLAPGDVPSLDALTAELHQMSPSGLLGALQAFEVQQPEVARTKRDGLRSHYGFKRSELRYFDVHEHEDVHIRYGQQFAATRADQKGFQDGLQRGAEIFYRSLDVFVDHTSSTR